MQPNGLTPENPFVHGKCIFRFTTNPEDDITGVDDMATEYVVIERRRADAGLVIWGKYADGTWTPNWGGRHVIKRLLEMLRAVHRQHDEPCRLDHNRFCQAHYCSDPCFYGEIRKAMEDEKQRCETCGWPLVADAKDGCTLGNCSQRPLVKEKP